MFVTQRIAISLTIAFIVAPTGGAYVRRTVNGAALRRPDFANVQFLVNGGAVAGRANAQGQPIITADSDPVGALRAALAAWNAIPTSAARFAPLGTTTAGNNPNDGLNVFVFGDTPEIRSAVGDNLAVTIYRIAVSGQIVETDIIFNPAKTFSTTQADGTYDLQSIATHELGHALGSDHSGVLAATMFWATNPGQTNQRRLSPDDIAFASSAYPPPGGNGYGAISGRLTTTAGAPIRGGFVNAVDPDQGIAIDGLSSLTDGTYSFQVPPGNYQVYAEPLVGDTKPVNLNLASNQVDTAFEPGFFGGVNSPGTLPVTAGAVATADVAAPPGPSPVQVQFVAVLPVGRGGSFALTPGPKKIASGQSMDLVLFGPGIDGSLSDSSFRIIGPATVRAGSVHLDSATVSGQPLVRLTLDVPARATTAIASLVITKGADTGVFSGGVVLTPPKPVFTTRSAVNAASFIGGGISPGEIISIFGTNVGPATPVPNTGFDSSGSLPTNLGDVNVFFGGVLAPLFYVSPTQINVQVPYEVANASATSVSVQVGGAESDRISVPVVPGMPGIFQIPGSARAIVVNQNNDLNSPQAPAPRGSVVTIYATGQGVVSPPVETGKAAPDTPLSGASNVTATIGGVPARVLFGGLTPGFVGLLQVNAEIPAGVTPGPAVPIQIGAAGGVSQPEATIAVQ